jgi:hypothetical protein
VDKAMSPKEYLDKHIEIGKIEHVKRVVEAAGTNFEYFKQITTGFRRAGHGLAKELSAKSVELSLDGKMVMTKEEIRPDIFDKAA